jgi:hypothetical protein
MVGFTTRMLMDFPSQYTGLGPIRKPLVLEWRVVVQRINLNSKSHCDFLEPEPLQSHAIRDARAQRGPVRRFIPNRGPGPFGSVGDRYKQTRRQMAISIEDLPEVAKDVWVAWQVQDAGFTRHDVPASSTVSDCIPTRSLEGVVDRRMDWTVVPSLERTLNQGLAHLSKEMAVRKIQQFLKRQIADRDAEFIGRVEQQVGDSPRVEGWRIGQPGRRTCTRHHTGYSTPRKLQAERALLFQAPP